jgi:hypothetical protein
MYLVTCPDCGDQTLPTTAVRARYCVDDRTWSYWFTCPSCAKRTAGQVTDERTVDALASTATYIEDWHRPAELVEPRPDGPAFCHADLTALAEMLDDPEWPRFLENAR